MTNLSWLTNKFQKFRVYSITVCCAVFILSSCSSEMDVPRNVLKPKTMQAVIFDLLQADEFVVNYLASDSTLDKKKETIKLYEQVFKIHGVTKDEFYKSYKYYQQNPDKNKVLFDSLYNWGTRKKDAPPQRPKLAH